MIRRLLAKGREALSRACAALAGRSHPSITPKVILAFCLVLVILSTAAYFLSSQYQTLGGTYFLIDDAWIHLQLARNLAEGYGFSFNPGHPIAAATAPLWTVVLAASYLATGELVLSAYFWGIAFFAVTCFLVYKLVLLMTDRLLLAAASAIVCALCPWLTWSALSGMEIMLSAALILLALFLHLRYQESRGWRAYLGVAAAGFTTLARPETYVLFLAIVIHRVALSLFLPRRDTRYSTLMWLPVAASVFALIVLPYGLFSLATAGSFFPSTYAAKVGDLGLLGAIRSGSLEAIKVALFTDPMLYLGDFVQAIVMISPVLAVTLPFGMLGLLRKDVWLLPLFLVLFPVVVGMVVPTDRVSWPWHRHMLNLVPVFVVVSLVGNCSLLGKIQSMAPKWTAPVRSSLMAVLILCMGFFFLAWHPSVMQSFVYHGAKMKTEHVSVAGWINRHLPPQATIAASDIGVIGFYTQRFIIDTEGLITPEILGESRRNSPAKDQEVYHYLQEAQPDYLVKFRGVYPSLLEAGFTPIHRSGNLVVYRTPWTRY